MFHFFWRFKYPTAIVIFFFFVFCLIQLTQTQVFFDSERILDEFGIETNEKKLIDDNNLIFYGIELNNEFRILWPRGEMGSLPADSEQFMLIEHLAGELEKLTSEIENGQAPFDQQQKLTLEFYERRINSLEAQIEKLKDMSLQMKNGNH